MEKLKFTCPACGVDLGEALSQDIIEKRLKEERELLQSKGTALTQKEDQLRIQERKLQEQGQTIQEEITRRLKEAHKQIAAEEGDRIRKEVGEEKAALEGLLKEKDAKLRDFSQRELQLLKDKNAIEEQRNQIELTVQRTLEEERAKIKAQAASVEAEKSQLIIADKDRKLEQLAKTVDELNRKINQGSQQSQGEVLEDLVGDILRTSFPLDEIADVPKGVKGADFIQKVQDRNLGICGVIIWEGKRTTRWNEAWIAKVKDDQRSVGADVAVIVTEVLPKEIRDFGVRDGVWVGTKNNCKEIATMLRWGIIEIARSRQAGQNRESKTALMYDYLTSGQFKQRMEGIIEPFRRIKDATAKERAAMEKVWARRDMELNKVIAAAAGMFGDFEAIVGSDLPAIEYLNIALPDHTAADSSQADSKKGEEDYLEGADGMLSYLNALVDEN